MPIDRFVAVVAATMGCCGLIFILLGTFRLSSDLIARLAAMPYGGFSLERLKSLSKQKAHTAAGTLLVFIGVALQIYALAYIGVNPIGWTVTGLKLECPPGWLN